MDHLSDRLLKISNYVSIDDSFCDIGTDHGYLPIYLKELNPNRKIILTDVSLGSLNKAKDNCLKYSKYDFDFRLGDGLKVLDNSEVDTVCIAGMGGLLISNLLNYDLNKSHSINRYILQPRNHIGDLRYFLYKNNFDIFKTELVKEGRFICEILVVENSKKSNISNDLNDFKSIEWEVPESLLETKSELLREYLNRKLIKEKMILFNLYSATKIIDEKISEQKERIAYLKNMLDKI